MSPLAKLVTYDALGHEVATLVNEKLSAGSNQVDWSALGGRSCYPIGVYYYKLITYHFVDVKKMLLVK